MNSININVTAVKEGYRAKVLVNKQFYAAVDSSSIQRALQEAYHYARQIEFDENGNW